MITPDKAKRIAQICVRPELEAMLLDPERDLNAMHEAEKVLNPVQAGTYIDILIRATRPVTQPGWSEIAVILYATAAQRADAFLLTLG